ncbi:ATP-dependent DNA helicase, partial [Chloroflexota bacterium]
KADACIWESRGKARTGLLSQIDNCLRSNTLALSRKRQLKQLTESVSKHLDKIRRRSYQFWDKLRDFIERNSPDYGEYDRQLRLTLATRTQQEWDGVENLWEELNAALESLAEDLNRLYFALEDLPENTTSGYDYLLSELSYLFRRNQELRNQIDSLVSNPERDNIYWLTLSGQGNTVNISSAPLSVSKLLGQYLFSAKDSVILTSATLSIEGTFEYIEERLGLEDVNELFLGASFDYPQSAMIYLTRDIPKPGSANYQQAIEKALVELCRASRGRTLVLFTSHSGLRATQAAIQTPLEEDGILVLGQGVNGSPKQLLATFKTNPRTVILGTASLWEGIDVVGEALSVLVIVRLPFNVPTEPVFAARSELLDEPFNQYSIPQAVLRFKQGFGRLIRSKTDRGAMAVLDSRLCSKQYGSAFLDSIPLCTVIRGSSTDLPATVARWLDAK